MACPSCGATQPVVGRFCVQCRVALVAITCTTCGYVNAPGGRFCENCGHLLAAESTAPVATASVPSGGIPRAAPAVYASFGRRWAALIIDTVLVVMVVILPIAYLTATGRDFTASLLAWGSGSFYFWIGNAMGGTPAKRLLGVRVIDLDGKPPGLTRGFMRSIIPNWIGVFVVAGSSAVILAILVGIVQLADPFAMLRSPLGQTWHDRMAGTYVVRV